MDKQPLILAELEDLSSLSAPLKANTRVKYTCFNVSSHLLVLGASSGGLYVFRREPCVFLQLLPSKDGAIIQLAISPDERFIGVATVRGCVSLVERGQRGARVVAVSQEHSGSVVTALGWRGNELYIGDSLGRVSVLARAVFQPPACMLMQLDSQVVQLDVAFGLLLVSTLTRSYVCDTERELYRQIGQKLRDGPFGACFISTLSESERQESVAEERVRGAFSDRSQNLTVDYSHLQHVRIFCSRPGGRVWESDVEGVVLRTHSLRDELPPPRPITTDKPLDNNNVPSSRAQTVSFGKLFAMQSTYLFTYHNDAMYVVDPWKSEVVLWNDQLQDIVDVKVAANVAYVWCGSGRIHGLSLIPLDKFLVRMYLWKRYLVVAELCIEFSSVLESQLPLVTKLHVLKDLDERLRGCDGVSPVMLAALAPFLDSLRAHAKDTQIQSAQRLKSGIYQITRPNYLNLSHRSHSVSPDRVGRRQQGSTSSLPGLLQEEEEEHNISSSILAEEKDISHSILAEERDISHSILSDRLDDGAAQDEIIKSQQAVKLSHTIKLLQETPRPSRSLILKLLDDALDGQNLNEAKTVPFTVFLPPEDVTIVSKFFQQSLTNQCAIEYLQNLPEECETSHPKVLLDKISSSALVMDFKMSSLLRVFASVLDENTVVSSVQNLLPECYYLSLVEILRVFETNALSLSKSLSKPRTLNVALCLLRVGQVDQASRCELSSTEATYLALRLEDMLEGDQRRARSRDLWLQLSERAGGFTDMDDFAEDSLEAVEGWPRCECGFPVPGRHPPTRFPTVANALLRRAHSDPAMEVRVCSRAPSLWPLLLAKRQNDSLLHLIPLILHLGDIAELESRLAEMDRLLCEVSVRHLAGLKRGDCLNCGRKLPSGSEVGVTWSQLGLLLVKAVGSTAAVDILGQYSAEVRDLQPVFHQSVILAALMEKHSRGLRKGVVDVVGGRLQQRALMSPELRAQVFPESPSSSDSLECHWGGRVPLRATCVACAMPFSARVLSDAGVCVFRCLHAFHGVCLRRRDACPVCTSPT